MRRERHLALVSKIMDLKLSGMSYVGIARKLGISASTAVQAMNEGNQEAGPGYCHRCGRYSKSRNRHHPSYASPQEVVYLCRSCHRKCHVCEGKSSRLKSLLKETLERKPPAPRTDTCRHCFGSGVEPSHGRIGREMRLLRIKCGLSLREMAIRARTSCSHLSLLENGLRGWKLDKVEAYRRACR